MDDEIAFEFDGEFHLVDIAPDGAWEGIMAAIIRNTSHPAARCCRRHESVEIWWQ